FEMNPLPSFLWGEPLMLLTKYTSRLRSKYTLSGVAKPTSERITTGGGSVGPALSLGCSGATSVGAGVGGATTTAAWCVHALSATPSASSDTGNRAADQVQSRGLEVERLSDSSRFRAEFISNSFSLMGDEF